MYGILHYTSAVVFQRRAERAIQNSYRFVGTFDCPILRMFVPDKTRILSQILTKSVPVQPLLLTAMTNYNKRSAFSAAALHLFYYIALHHHITGTSAYQLSIPKS